MTAEDAINVFKEPFCGFEAHCEIGQYELCLTEDCERWWAIKALEQYRADVIEVVRCKDCKHNPKDSWFGCPVAHLSEAQRPETAWCWKGERKDG